MLFPRREDLSAMSDFRKTQQRRPCFPDTDISEMIVFFFKAEGSGLEFSYIVRVINVLFSEQAEARSLREVSSYP